jgi:hypothetical protein
MSCPLEGTMPCGSRLAHKRWRVRPREGEDGHFRQTAYDLRSFKWPICHFALSSNHDYFRESDVRSRRIVLKNPLGRRGRIAVATTIRAAEWRRSVSCGEGRRREGDELGQFPQILGGGGQ